MWTFVKESKFIWGEFCLRVLLTANLELEHFSGKIRKGSSGYENSNKNRRPIYCADPWLIFICRQDPSSSLPVLCLELNSKVTNNRIISIGWLPGSFIQGERNTKITNKRNPKFYEMFEGFFVPFLVGATVVACFNTFWMAIVSPPASAWRIFTLWKLGQWIFPEIVIRDFSIIFLAKCPKPFRFQDYFANLVRKFGVAIKIELNHYNHPPMVYVQGSHVFLGEVTGRDRLLLV